MRVESVVDIISGRDDAHNAHNCLRNALRVLSESSAWFACAFDNQTGREGAVPTHDHIFHPFLLIAGFAFACQEVQSSRNQQVIQCFLDYYCPSCVIRCDLRAPQHSVCVLQFRLFRHQCSETCVA